MLALILAAAVPLGIALLLATLMVLRKGPVRLWRATGLPGTEAINRELKWQDEHGRERNTVIG